ncbi:hypothetical protein AVEN_113923-1 [Araneus ventricosus]|uniref:Uncharacterized protein n=1 Tax=Araneus ventricosus TaxID=182803 RepID=A0A4Y2L2N5_ARAVE|nr:hypothetical protein AVEN_113923-1 [Araneus ventricosus]
MGSCQWDAAFRTVHSGPVSVCSAAKIEISRSANGFIFFGGGKHSHLLASRQSSGNVKSFCTVKAASSSKDSNASTSKNSENHTIDAFVLKNEVVDAEILWALKCIKSCYSYKSCTDVTQLFSRMFPDSEIARKFSCGEKKCAYICHFGLGPYFQTLLVDDCKNADFFTLLFDETLNQTNQKKQLDIHVRYWHKEECKVRTKYLTSTFIGHSTSEDLLSAFYECVVKLDLSKVLQISMDGPSVNWKFYSSLQENLSREYGIQSLTLGTCGLHILNNSFKHGISATGWDITSFLSSLYWIFKDCPARREDFLNVSSTKKFPVKFCSCRWLENVPAAERAIEIWNDILMFVKKIEMGKLPKITSKSFMVVLESTKDKTFLIKLHFFVSLSKVLLPFLEQYQSDKPLLPFFASDVLKLVNDCIQHFKILKPENERIEKPETLCKFNFSDPNLYNDKSKVYLGFSAEQLIKEKIKNKEIADKDVFTLRQDCRKNIITMIKHFMQKCPVNYALVRHAICIDPRVMAGYPEKAQEKMKKVLIVLSQNKRILEKDCDEIWLL